MKASQQGTSGTKVRYQTVPRTLIFLTSVNPYTQAQEVLLLKGASSKKWAGAYNGVGGHIEAGEDVYQSAIREVAEETGIEGCTLSLRGVVNIDIGFSPENPLRGVMMFVFTGESPTRTVIESNEGTLEWIPLSELKSYPLVDDLFELVPLVLNSGSQLVYGHYQPNEMGAMQYRFTT
ncbi:MAG: NUDIX domain-containing protein [Chloroflexota bacterium]